MFYGRSPYASRIGNKIPGRAKKTSKGERLRRWLSNKAIRVRRWYEPLARRLVAQASQHEQPLRLIVDGTRVGCGHQLFDDSHCLSKTRLTFGLDLGAL